MEKKAKKSHITRWSVLTAVTAILMIAVFIGSSIAQTYATVINVFLGTSEYEVIKGESDTDTQYFKSSFSSEEELVAHEAELCEAVEGEGATLLLNHDGALPLGNGAKVSCFGQGSADLLYGGTGSGQVDASKALTLKDALTAAGIDVNPSLWDFYSSEDVKTNYSRVIPDPHTDYVILDDYLRATPMYQVREVPWDMVSSAAGSSFAEYGDAAVVVLARSGGEGGDLPMGDNGSGIDWISGPDGNYLALTAEELDLLAQLKALKDAGTFQKIVVLLNSSNAIELDFLNPDICGVDYGIDAAMWIGDVGQTGINAVGKLLSGELVPSGSIVDTFCYDNLTSPAARNFYAFEFTNAKEAGLDVGDVQMAWGLSRNFNVNSYYSVYQEGIYVGYRYYETRYEDVVMGTGNAGNYDYASTVAYPFGYGLSYTDFEFSNFSVKDSGDAFDITVKVTNVGDTYSGKKTVQIYFQSPYTDYDKQNGIEKAAIELCGFAKTGILAPGASETVNITVSKEELRTYDANSAKTYILDAGDYYFTAANGAHEALNNVLAAKGYTVENTGNKMTADGNTDLVYKWTNSSQDDSIFATSSATGNPIVNLFDNADPNRAEVTPGTVTWLSRSDWNGTFPKENIIWSANDAVVAALQDVQYDPADYETVPMPTMGEDNGLTLAAMIGKSYDDPDWDLLLDQLTFEEMVQTITLGYHNTAAIPSIGKAATKDENGPQGLTASLTMGASAMCYTSADVLAATFNLELVEDVGRCMGEDCLNAGYSGLYGPGANIHRTPYSGRNFEYYSEDPYISGVICAAHTAGIQSKGVYAYLKHFALNDSETYRRGVSTWVNEQTAREIYLEAFAKPVTDGGCWCVMNSFPRWGTVWAGAHRGLQTDFLRGELGMRGMAITDYSSSSPYQDIAGGLLGGSDIWDSSSEEIHTVNLRNYKDDPVIVSAMRQALHRILFTVANSNAMNGLSAADRMKVVTPWWKAALTAAKVVFVVLTVACAAKLVIEVKNKKATGEVDTKK